MPVLLSRQVRGCLAPWRCCPRRPALWPADVSGLGKAEGIENAVPQRQVLLGCALGQAGRPRHDARLLDRFVAGELLAGQVYLRSIWKAIPPVDSLPAAISTEHLSQQQLATEQVVDGQRGRPALASGRVRGGPVSYVHRIAGIACPGGAHRGLDLFPRDG